MIRQATRYDIPRLLELIEQYCYEAPIDLLKNKQYHDAVYVKKLLFELIAGRGFILIDDEFKGMIGGIITPNIWCPKVMELHELFWWVKPKYRNGMLGGRLWVKFDDMAQKLLNSNRVQLIHATKMSTSPDLNYEKYGYKPLNNTFFRN